MMTAFSTNVAAAAPRRRPVLNLSLEEMVVWAYRDQKVDSMSAASLHDLERQADEDWHMGSGGLDSAERIRRRGELGTEIDGGGRSIHCHPDAELLHDEVCVLQRTDRHGVALIRRFGRTDEPPEWDTPEPRLLAVPVPDESRSPNRECKVDWIWDEPTKKRKPRIGRGETAKIVVVTDAKGEAIGWDLWVRVCPVRLYPPPEYITSLRKAYSDWHRAMTLLMQRINKIGFFDHRVTGFTAHPTPWSAA